MDFNRRLIVCGGGKGLRTARRYRGIALHKLGRDAAHRLDGERERNHIHKQNIFYISLKNARLDSRANGDDFVRVDGHIRFLAEKLFHFRLHLRHAGLAADENDLMYLGNFEGRGLHRALGDIHRSLNKFSGDVFKLRASHLDKQVTRTRCVAREERNINLRLHRA